ncbi:MAG TPA: site-specific DNA-methyltransferase [Polyangiaceae bacterium]|nr:site-specific DNA-methyltransferase [Polyangiaceae bacterium]
MRIERPITLAWNGRRPFNPEAVPDPDEASAEGPAPVRYAAETAEGVAGRYLFGDNLTGLRSLRAKAPGSVTLAYLDPPFHTNRVHALVEAGDRDAPKSERRRRAAFDDRWTDRGAYLEALGARLVEVRGLLAPHGSVVIHVDPKTSHYVKVLCDELFGEECFASEIVWRYRRWPSKTPNFQRVHDVLLRYRRDARVRPRWNTPYEPLAASTRATWGETKQRAVFRDDGHRQRSSTTEEASLGVPMGDVWEIGVLAPMSKERTGYPSQKPLALLDRLVLALSDPGEVVLDPYAGSGTTLVSAARLGRQFLGLDESTLSLETVTQRLGAIGATLRREDAGATPDARDDEARGTSTGVATCEAPPRARRKRSA